MTARLEYRDLEALRKNDAAWRLLAADHAPLVASFLDRAFVGPNLRTLAQQELVSRLDDYLFRLREEMGADAFPRTSIEYLDTWASDGCRWLRKFYPPHQDEAHYDLTPATEKAIDWLASLSRRQFVGTESRLMTVFELLRQMAEGTETDPEARIAELERRRASIDAEIQRIREGELVLMEPTQIKDRFQQMTETARGLLSDFREVEQNFRDLDRSVRERIAEWEGGKGALLEEVFGERDLISDSDQGRSFRAFWDFLASPARQEELTRLLAQVLALAPVREMRPDPRLRHIHHDWLEAGDGTQRTVARLSEQLRRYLDDRAWLENRRIMQLLHGIERHALALREAAPEGALMELDETAPEVSLDLDRPLYAPPFKPSLTSGGLKAGDETIAADALFDQTWVDREALAAHIRKALKTRTQVSLAELVELRPLEQGLAELVAYLSLAAESDHAVIDDAGSQTLTWSDAGGERRRATLPLVLFNRPAASRREAQS